MSDGRARQTWRSALNLMPLIVAVCAGSGLAHAAEALPAGMSFVAQDAAGAWSLYRVDDKHQPVRMVTEFEPRQACVSPSGRNAVYAAADGSLRVIRAAAQPEAARETVIAQPTPQRSYTQPCLVGDSGDVVAVEMADGKSIETEILRFAGSSEPVRIARQPGAQHDPYVHQGRRLVYTSVSCSEGCDRLLVEIWSRDLITADARQLTLLNALSQSPVTDGRRVVFSSNASGSFQLWQVGIDGVGVRRLTDGLTQATQPALCGGDVFFVKSGPEGSSIARLADGGAVAEVVLPGLKSFRALRCVS
jgi:WD40-like Beta Propeller Repeat